MNVGWKQWGMALAAGGAICAPILAEVSLPTESPYHPIIDRNPFALRPPPVVPDKANPTNAPAVKLNLQISGITAGPEGKYVWLVVPPPPAVGKAATNTTTKHWKLREGEEQDGVKVVEINEIERWAKVSNADTVETLDLLKDCPPTVGPALNPQLPGGAAGMNRPGAIPAPNNPAMTLPGNPGGAARGGVGGSAVPPAPSVQRVGGQAMNFQGGGGMGGEVSLDGGSVGVRTVPARPIRTSDMAMQPDADPAAQFLMLKAQEQQAAAQGVMLPPTPPVIP